MKRNQSFTPAQRSRLISLEAKMDQYLFGQHYDEKTGKMVDDSGVLPAVATGAGIAAGGYGGYKAIQVVGKKMGDLANEASGTGAFGRNASAAAKAYASKGTAGKVVQASGAVGSDLLDYVKKVGSKMVNRSELEAVTRKIELGLGYGEQVGGMLNVGVLVKKRAALA